MEPCNTVITVPNIADTSYFNTKDTSIVSDRPIGPSCVIYFGLVITLCDRNITASVVIWLLCRSCCRRCKMLQKFFHSFFYFGNTRYFFYLIDMLLIKRQLAQLKNVRLASVEHFKKQKLE